MTENEAKLILEEIKQLGDTMYDYSGNYMKALDIAIKALEEVQEYRKLGTVEEVGEAVEKTKPMNPEITDVSTGTKYMKCPKCKLTTVIYNEMIVGYCPKCGQRLESEEL